MSVHTGELRFETEGDGHVVDLTGGVAAVVRQSAIQHGTVSVFVPGATAAITTMEYEPGGVNDLRELLDRLIPREGNYEHNRLNHDSNSHAHMRAAIVGPSETIPIVAGELRMGTWQQVVLIDFDDRPRQRTVVVSVTG